MSISPMTGKLFSIPLSAIGLMGLLACGGHSESPAPVPDVYVVGYESSGVEMGNAIPNVAKCWKGGVVQVLTPETLGAVATSVAVSRGDVYIAGHENAGTQDVAKYWKNGSPVSLTDGTQDAWANAICVSGSDVYVGGGEGQLGGPIAASGPARPRGTRPRRCS